MTKTLIALVLVGCGGSLVPTPKKLLIVAPSAWTTNIAPYVAHKQNQGYKVTTVPAEDAFYGTLDNFGDNLKNIITAYAPEFVFLIGDQSFVPTIYKCADITSWNNSFTNWACNYSDQWMFDGPIGRLQAKTTTEVDNYVAKALVYDASRLPTTNYVLGDVNYDVNYAKSAAEQLGNANYGNSPDVTRQTVGDIFSQGVRVFHYFGHGFQLGFDGLTVFDLKLFNTVPAPLVFAMACSTAQTAPNPPWDAYYDANSVYHDFTGQSGLTPDKVGHPASLQFHTPNDVVGTNVMSRAFTSNDHNGAMVYIGDTVVTHPDYALASDFYGAMRNSRIDTIGEAWYGASKGKAHPEYFQFVGDPSTRK